MKLIQSISILVGAGSLAAGFQAEGRTRLAGWMLLFGLVWLLAEIKRWRAFLSFAFLISVAAAVYGLWIGVSIGWMLAGALGALIAWDLSEFQIGLPEAAPDDEVREMTRRHLLRLVIVTGIGLGLSLVRMIARLQCSFEWVAFLALLSAVGVSLKTRQTQKS